MNNRDLHKMNGAFIRSQIKRDSWQKELDQFQQSSFSFRNFTDQSQSTKVWGAAINEEASEGQVRSGTYPVHLLWNPINELFYVCCQLSNNVWIYSRDGEYKCTINLEESPSLIASPVQQTVDVTNGKVYLVGSISNRIYVISPKLYLERKIPTDVRPVCVEVDPLKQKLLVAHLYLNRISVIDIESGEVEIQFESLNSPIRLIRRKSKAELLVYGYKSRELNIYLESGEKKGTVELEGRLIQAELSENERYLYGLVADGNVLVKYDLETTEQTARIALEKRAKSLVLVGNHQIVIANEEGGILVFNSDLESQDQKPSQGVMLAPLYDKKSKAIFYCLPYKNQLAWLNLKKEGVKRVQTSDDYQEAVQEYQSHPIILKHAKITFKGEAEAPVLRIGSRTPGGVLKSKLISLNRYRSPHHFINQFEVSEMENEIIDGKSFWELLIPPEGEVNVMLFYQ